MKPTSPVPALLATFTTLLALVVLATVPPANASAQDGATQLPVLDLGDARSSEERVRARLLTQLLRQVTADHRVQLQATERLSLRLPAGASDIGRALLRAGEALPRRITTLLARPWRGAIERGAPTLAAFMVELHEGRGAPIEWRCRTVEVSLAKPLARRICRTRAQDVSLAATLLPDGRVREWEVVSTRQGREAIEFLVFDGAGRRTPVADFGDVQEERLLPAPQSCAACHYDPATDSFRQQPSFAPAQPWLRWEDSVSGADPLRPEAL